MKDILIRLQKLEKNLTKDNKPNAALVCSDAAAIITQLRPEFGNKVEPVTTTDSVKTMLGALGVSGIINDMDSLVEIVARLIEPTLWGELPSGCRVLGCKPNANIKGLKHCTRIKAQRLIDAGLIKEC